MFILKWLMGFLTGPVIDGLIKAYTVNIEARSKTEALAVEVVKAELDAEIRLRQENAAIIKAEQGWWLTAMIRPAFALIVIVYFAKVVIWDTVLGLGTTPAIKGDVGEWMGVIITTYFGGRTVEKVARIVTSKGIIDRLSSVLRR